MDGGAEETADAVGDEVGRVLAGDDAFAQVQIAEIGDGASTPGGVAGPGMISARCR